jgi:hypothetical protein
MNQRMLRAFLDELEKIAGEGLNRMVAAARGHLVKDVEHALEHGVHGEAPRMRFIPKPRGIAAPPPPTAVQRGALNLVNNPKAFSQMQAAARTVAESDALLAAKGLGEGGRTFTPRSMLAGVGKGVLQPEEFNRMSQDSFQSAARVTPTPTPQPVSGIRRPGPTAPVQAPRAQTTTGRFIPTRSGVQPVQPLAATG